MIKKNVQKLKINGYNDREKVVVALANSGYKVWVENKSGPGLLDFDEYFVCYEEDRRG